MNANAETLYDRAGGEAGVTKLVDIFYQRVLNDPELSPFFAHIPMAKLRRMQVEFFSSALNGPLHYSGRPLAHVHRSQLYQPSHGLDTNRRHKFTAAKPHRVGYR